MNYLYRHTTLFGISELCEVLNYQVVKKHFVPILQQMSKDAIPNIRMNVAKTISRIREHWQKQGQTSQVEPQTEQELQLIINDLMQDEDDDVKFFARKAYNAQF